MKELLIVVDYQNDFVDGALGFEGAEKIEAFISKTIDDFKRQGHDIVFTLDTHGENYMETEEGKNLPFIHCVKGTKGHQIHGSIKGLAEGYPQIEKPTFGSAELLEFLKGKEYGQITIVGLDGSICVFANAIIAKSALPNAHIVVLKDGCDSGDKEALNTAYKAMQRLQIEVK